MTSFGQLLKTLIVESGESISKIAQLTGIDRPTIYKYISGSRMPTREGLSSLLHSIRATAKEKEQIIAQYELESAGETAYYQRQAVKRLLDGLKATAIHPLSGSDDISDLAILSNHCTDELSVLHGTASIFSEIMSQVENEKTKISIYPNIPATLLHFIVDAIVHKGKNELPLDQIWRYPKRMKADEEVRQCIDGLTDVISLSLNPHINYQTLYYYGSGGFRPADTDVFPYTIVFSNAVIRFDADITCAMVIRQWDVVQIYKQHFNILKNMCYALVSCGEDAMKTISIFSELENQCGQIYKLMLQPCLPKYASQKTVKRILDQIAVVNADMAIQMSDRMPQLRAMQDDKSIFFESGIASFARNGFVADIPEEIDYSITREERIEVLKALREDCRIREYRMLKSGVLSIPENVMVEICQDVCVTFVLTDIKSHNVAVIQEIGVVNAFCDFAEYLLQSNAVATETETIEIIDRYISELEKY